MATEGILSNEAGQGVDLPKTVESECEPLPEVVIPEELLQERAAAIRELLLNPPVVDCLLVLDRSGTLAASGLYDDPAVSERFQLPAMHTIAGIGNEVWDLFYDEMDAQDRDDEISDGIGDEGSEEVRAVFLEWVQQSDNSLITTALAQLRTSLSNATSFAILDDVKQYGTVSAGILPAYTRIVFNSDEQYRIDQNRFIFDTLEWVREIVRATFVQALPNLTTRQENFLREIAKGSSDNYRYSTNAAPHTLEHVTKLANYYGTNYWSDERAARLPNESLDELVTQFGPNLLSLHQNIVEKLRDHTRQVISEM